MILTRLLRHRPGGWRGAAAACLCATAVAVAGCASAPAGQPGAAGPPAGTGQVVGLFQASSAGWQAVKSDTGHRLYDVACLSALRCEAVGAAGTIVATVNGGRTWRQQVNPLRGSATPLYAITCVAPSSCYVIARPDTILVTHNGGATWSRHVLAVGVTGTNYTDQACVPGYTSISGRPAVCRLGLLDIACVSASVCSAVATAPAAYDVNPIPKSSHATLATIWLTSDGGAKWTRQSIPRGVACDGDCQSGLYGYPLEWITCLSSGRCLAGGGHVLDCGHCGFAYAVVAARSPGKSWTCVQPAATCTSLAPDVTACPTSTRCYGVQSTNPFGSGVGVGVYKSSDSGADWGSVGPAQGWSSSVLNDIACPNTLTCYLAGSHGSIAKITNGNRLAGQHTPTTRDLYGIACTGPDTCYAVGNHGTLLVLR